MRTQRKPKAYIFTKGVYRWVEDEDRILMLSPRMISTAKLRAGLLEWGFEPVVVDVDKEEGK